MIKKLKKILINSTLLVILLILIGAPIGSMMLIKVSKQDKGAILSTQSILKIERLEEGSLSETELPEEIEEIIEKLEREFYQTLETTQEQEPSILQP